ncbi:ATP-binding cassette domain-containing protein [Catellatospora coxensis]|uniref:UvrABC system protein A n=1 Tax=Catellatospora coxensis TaxID=310354 RepID=A0A8J3L0S7_9ACTN|nr:excinuclease ABC subunit UvrA [Catellatospora coxensis]GIG10385.1 excinuclease ABC subunit A [Catellatospora coxensis]
MTTADYGFIQVRGARENNLKDISLDIPKRKITLFTGVSGSGKSSLVFDTIAAESQRLINETYTAFLQSLLPGYGQPDVDSLENLSAAIIVDQKRLGGNSRSTVGTVTDAYSMLRLIFARLGSPAVANPGVLSFNDPGGMCPDCEGLGDVAAIDEDAIVERDKSLNEGAILLSGFNVDSWFWAIITQSGFFDNDKKLRDYTADEWHRLMYLPEAKVKLATPAGSMNSTYEGLVPKFKRLYLTKQTETTAPHIRAAIERIATRSACPACGGARLNAAALACRIDGRNIAECAAMEVADLAGFIRGVDAPTLAPMLNSLAARLDNLTHIGLGYLSLNRPSATLSGGESQRVKMVRHLGSSLTDMTYVFDEPSVGLHPHDVHRLNELLVRLRDKGNTVLVVEHRPSVIAIADHVVDMGPRAGRDGGQVVYAGDLAGLAASGTLTGEHLSRHQALKPTVRTATGKLVIKDAALHNLKDVTASIPQGVLTVVTGVAGSGKSPLIQGCLPRHHPDAIFIDQRPIRGSKRSTPATYTGVLDPIRKAFAKANGVNAALFSANSKGACPQCQGIGLLYTDLAFMDPVVSTCEACDGRRFLPEVLEHTLRGQNISDVLRMQITEAASFFTEKAIKPTMTALVDVGLGYLTLGQSLDTLSGGERQRLKLATELGNSSRIYVLDEPTTGLHMNDVDNLIGLLDRLVDGGSTVIVIEHNLDVISRADWIIDMGPGAGHDGGRIVFAGTPHDLLTDAHSLTATHLRTHLS